MLRYFSLLVIKAVRCFFLFHFFQSCNLDEKGIYNLKVHTTRLQAKYYPINRTKTQGYVYVITEEI